MSHSEALKIDFGNEEGSSKQLRNNNGHYFSLMLAEINEHCLHSPGDRETQRAKHHCSNFRRSYVKSRGHCIAFIN